MAAAHRKRLCTRLKLPKSVKEILTKPKDEESWDKLEQLRHAINSVVEGEDFVLVENEEEATAIGNAIQQCDRGVFADEVGHGCRLPAGCRLRLDGDPQGREKVAAQVDASTGEWVRILKRPLGTCRAPLVDDFGKQLVAKTVGDMAREQSLGQAEMLDNMLLCLFDALWLAQSEAWTNRGVANMPADEAP